MTGIGGAATKTTPVDADGVVIADSEAENATKRVLWSRVKAVLKGYFDTLYLGLGGGTLTGALVVATSLYIRASGNRHLWFQNDAAVALGLVYSDATTGDMYVRTYAANGVDYVTFAVRRDGRVSLPDTVSQSNDATSKRYVDAGDSANASAAAAAQSTANTANSAASAAQSTANARIIRDSASHAGFAGGDANQPYMRTGTDGSGAVIRLARYDQIAGLATGVNTTVNGVGSYAFLYWNGSVSTINPGTNISGSELAWSNASGANPGTGGPSGSWRLCGYVQTSSNLTRTSLWVRYA